MEMPWYIIVPSAILLWGWTIKGLLDVLSLCADAADEFSARKKRS